MNEHRTNTLRSSDQTPGAYLLAVFYTLGFLLMIGGVMFFEAPTENRDLLIYLSGIMSAAQLGIIKHYFDSTKGAEQAQAASIARSSRSEGTINELAKAAPEKLAAAVVAANGKPLVSADVRIRAQQDSTRVQAEIDWTKTEIIRVEAERVSAKVEADRTRLELDRSHLQGKL